MTTHSSKPGHSSSHILFILDRSGSMASCAHATVAAFNDFLAKQRDLPGVCHFTLVLFDDLYEIPYAAIPLAEIAPLTLETFVPRGSTALLDAMGRSIDDLATWLDPLPKPDRPGSVIVATLTDGLENASTRFTYDDIQRRITHRRENDGWDFLFLGANQDAIAAAAKLGIAPDRSASFQAHPEDVAHSFDAINRKTIALRKSRAQSEMSLQEMQDLQAPLQELLDEERDGRDRK
ncbi:MAG: hypothetical protein SNJ52_00475 [Verrucomicrobiia bacterium]